MTAPHAKTPAQHSLSERCLCHDIGVAEFRAAHAAGAQSVKACFKHIGCMPKCAGCVPMVRKVLSENNV